jgi:hypothetical protein
LLILVAGALPATAQDCGGLPCGDIPWLMPEFPRLASPTPFPTNAITATPTPGATATGAPTNTPTPTMTPTINIGDVSGGVDQLNQLLTATAQVIYDVNGTPVAVGTVAYDYQVNASTAMSYIKALGGADFGVVTPLVQFFIGALLFILAVKLVEISIPFIAILFGSLRKVVQVVLDFIPF